MPGSNGSWWKFQGSSCLVMGIWALNKLFDVLLDRPRGTDHIPQHLSLPRGYLQHFSKLAGLVPLLPTLRFPVPFISLFLAFPLSFPFYLSSLAESNTPNIPNFLQLFGPISENFSNFSLYLQLSNFSLLTSHLIVRTVFITLDPEPRTTKPQTAQLRLRLSLANENGDWARIWWSLP